ncbi:hypothetical protein DEM27_32555 [Metarhizobium album]|uniref:Uncharacterized protein n=1 Tax=Metarhizobium album TaxID=2182425 RepID=A0A2U2DFN3_9HYPH|nr:hypothetical protein [Rhizobium album]PWE52133.1 hypothetical protein DEM27_32555 [Rhizobium album]
MLRSVLGFLLISVSASQAAAQTPDQKTALEIMAGAAVVTQYCDYLELNNISYGIIMELNGIEADDLQTTGRFAGFLYEKMVPLMAEMNAATPEQVCAMGVLAYGPEGKLFANMLRWKKRN